MVMGIQSLQEKYEALSPVLNERSRRRWAAVEARALGHGGIAAVEEATGISRSTIARGLRELKDADDEPLEAERIRRPGGGRKPVTEKDPTILESLERLVEPTTAGQPDAPLRWTSKSLRNLASELKEEGHDVSHPTVGTLLKDLGYTLQANRKTREGTSHPDRDAQFGYLNEQVRASQAAGHPVISVDTKKKELVGDFKNPGQEWRPKGMPEEVRSHDFKIPGPEGGKAIPYGVYDLTRDEGWVSVGIDHDTGSFAVHSIARWWEEMGQPAYQDAPALLITADCGGSNGTRIRLWKWELQQFANRSGLTITVCHFPPGTSKWNKIEHRFFSFIAMNWRGKPLFSLATIVNLIGSTTTRSGLRIRSEIDHGTYPKGVKISKAQMESLTLERHEFHGDWNYTIRPQSTPTT